MQHILKNRPRLFQRSSYIKSILNEAGFFGVFSAEGEDWKHFRQLINPAFKASNLNNMLPTINKHTVRCLNILENKPKHLQITELLTKLTVDITSELCFSYDINTLESSDSHIATSLNKIFPIISKRIQSPIPYWRFWKRKEDREFDHSIKKVQGHISIFIQDETKRIDNQSHTQNILSALLLAKDNKGLPFEESAIYGNILTLLLAGEDTSSYTLAWTLYFLCKHELFQEELYQEVTKNYPETGINQIDQLSHFPLILSAIQESLRLKPVVPLLTVENQEETNLLDYKIPKNTLIFVLLCPEAKNAELFPNPEKYDPYRWLNLSKETQEEFHHTLANFGVGSRICPGRYLALAEMRIFLIELIRRFKISFSLNTPPVTSKYASILIPENLNIDISSRNTHKI